MRTIRFSTSLLLALCALLWAAEPALADHYIQDNATGGDGHLIGDWNQTTKTLTLTQDVDEPIVILSDWIVLDGAGYEVSAPATAKALVIVDDGVTDVVVRNCVGVGSGQLYGIRTIGRSPRTRFEGNEVSGTGYGLFIGASDGSSHDSVVHDNVATDCAEGVRLNNSNGCEITDNETHDNGFGIRVSSGDDLTIQGNKSHRNYHSSAYGSGLMLAAVSNSTIEGNMTDDNERGINLTGDGNTLKNNEALRSTHYGIFIRGSNNDVLNCKANDGESSGFRLEDGTGNDIRDCEAASNDVTGINVGRCDETVIEDNTCTGNYVGIGASGSDNELRRNKAHSNLSTGFRLAGEDGILEGNFAHGNGSAPTGNAFALDLTGFRHVIRGNEFKGSGIRDTNFSHTPTGNNTIEGNKILNPVGFGIRNVAPDATIRLNEITGATFVSTNASGYGVWLGATGAFLADNTIRDCTGNGIELRGSVSNPGDHEITRNWVEGCDGFGIYAPSSGGSLIYDNYFLNGETVGGTSTSTLANAWNVSQRAGPNIIGGPYIGGNFWGNEDGDGFSQTCDDANGDGFCDQALTIRTPDNFDYLPLVENTRPSCNPTGGGVYECGVDTVTLGGSVMDNDGDLVTYEWRNGTTVLFSGTVQTITGGTPVALPNHVIAAGDLALGVHTLELAVEDETHDEHVCEIVVEVIDTSDPTMAPTSSDQILWPPNHQLESVTIQANADDACDGALTLTVEVESDEHENGLGDGDVDHDWQNLQWNSTTGVITVDLRAERSGTADGRTYTITITATDASGNNSVSEVTVLVPHSRGNGN